jgi:hypothetical protein
VWWSSLAEGPSPHQKGLASLTLLTVWKIWKERNTRIFCHNLSSTFVIVDNIKCEARLWVLAERSAWVINTGRVGFVTLLCSLVKFVLI